MDEIDYMDMARYAPYTVNYTEWSPFHISTYPHEKLWKTRDQISLVIIFSFGVMEDFTVHRKQNYSPISFYN